MNARRGLLLMAVLACLSIVTALAMTALTSTIRAHRNARHSFQLRQTQLLIDSAVHRARVQISQNADYTGETWEPSLPNESIRASVMIQFDAERLSVTATLISADGFQTQRSDTIFNSE